jgi:hypothetical protein
VPFDPEHLESAPDPVLAGVVTDVATHFTKDDPLSLLSMPSVETLFPTLGAFTPSAQFEPLPPLEPRPDYATACIIHSSGSTAWPKPIHITERSALSWLCAPHHTDYPYGPDIRFGAMALPVFHAMGFYSTVALPMATGTRTSFFRPANRSEGTGIESVTVDTVLAVAAQLRCNALFVAPTMLTVRCLYDFLTHDAQSPNQNLTWPSRKPYKTLQRSNCLRGSTSSASVADHSTKTLETGWLRKASRLWLDTGRESAIFANECISRGIAISRETHFSVDSTECGCFNVIPSPYPDDNKEWQYWKLNPSLEAKLEPGPDKGLYELVIKVNPDCFSLRDPS